MQPTNMNMGRYSPGIGEHAPEWALESCSLQRKLPCYAWPPPARSAAARSLGRGSPSPGHGLAPSHGTDLGAVALGSVPCNSPRWVIVGMVSTAEPSCGPASISKTHFFPLLVFSPCDNSLWDKHIGSLISAGCFKVLSEDLSEICNFIPIYQNSYFSQNKMTEATPCSSYND